MVMKYRKLFAKHFAQKSNNTQIALALITGLAAGAIISILFAPDSGAGTREKMARKAKNLRYGFQDKYNLLKEKVFGIEAIEKAIIKQEVPPFERSNTKKPKRGAKNITEDKYQNRGIQKG
jgi:gas vesicle protein